MARRKPLEFVSVTQDELTELLSDKPTCKYCGKSIWYENIKVSYKQDGTVHSDIRGTTYRTVKTLNDKSYPICVCQHCLEQKYPDFSETNKFRIFNTFNEYVSYAFDIPIEEINAKNKTSVPTLDNFIKKYGELEGKKRFDIYRQKQAYTNSYEYKKEKYGWSKEQFDEYNKSRAVTYDNLIKKHGKEKGEKIWNHYIDRQSYTASTEYLIEAYGEDYAKTVNLCKGHNLSGFVQKYGKEKGNELFNAYIENIINTKSYSPMSKCFFDELVDNLNKNNIVCSTRYGEFEYAVITKNGQTYFYDFYIPELNMIIEFNGDYWHCNPKIYNKDYIHPHKKITAEKIWEQEEIRRTDIIDNFNCQYITVWESDVKKDKELIISKLIEQIKKRIEDVSKNK